MSEIFIQLSITLGIALLFSLLMKLLRQPLIIGYILTGIVVGPSVTGLVNGTEILESFSSIGVALLLFIVGLGLQPQMIKDLGKSAIIGGLLQIFVTGILAFVLSRLMGIGNLPALYIAFGFTLSSTIIVSRLLSSKDDAESLFGRLAVGFLLVQDFLTMFFFLFLSGAKQLEGGNFISGSLLILGKFSLIVLGLLILKKYVTPRIDKIFAKNHELLFVFSIAICFLIATSFYKLGFSLELGALLAGVTLSLSPYQREIAMRLHSLRDFFLIIFFILLGANVYIANLSNSLIFLIVFLAFVVIVKPVILFFIMRFLKYTVKTSFLSSLTFSQISEFSLILLGMGVSLGHLSRTLVGEATFIGIISIALSSYLISYNDGLYALFKKPLNFFFRDYAPEKRTTNKEYKVIVLGCHRLGGGVVNLLKKRKTSFLVLDHDPEVIRLLTEKKIPCLYGSADDTDLLDSLNFKKVETVISTIPDLELNLFLLGYLKRERSRVNFLAVSNHAEHAEKLYKMGASYVIMPPYLGRRFVADLFKKYGFNKQNYQVEKKRHLNDLQYVDANKLI